MESTFIVDFKNVSHDHVPLEVFCKMGYLPKEIAVPGKSLFIEYFDEGGDGLYPITVQIVGKGSLYDPNNERVRA